MILIVSSCKAKYSNAVFSKSDKIIYLYRSNVVDEYRVRCKKAIQQ